jgi:hypothetical protein
MKVWYNKPLMKKKHLTFARQQVKIKTADLGRIIG